MITRLIESKFPMTRGPGACNRWRNRRKHVRIHTRPRGKKSLRWAWVEPRPGRSAKCSVKDQLAGQPDVTGSHIILRPPLLRTSHPPHTILAPTRGPSIAEGSISFQLHSTRSAPIQPNSQTSQPMANPLRGQCPPHSPASLHQLGNNVWWRRLAFRISVVKKCMASGLGLET